MFLKSLVMHGFKSFADRTLLTFKPGVTAVVGPNGCGKSNVVDAVRWVLGESNARSLRGEVMSDVIFNGSEERKPLGMAEVSLTLVNEEGFLPIEYSEVNITRRLYRSGESEFFINRNNVRLRDIQDLFADTGIGKEAYSVMEQGNIDLILSNRPEERMVIFEEAAGISRYKMRMKESYKKLAATEENILRLNIILNEVEKEYRSLEKQAEKALRYKRLRKEEIEYETLFTYERIQSLRRQMEKNGAILRELREKRESGLGEISRLNEAVKRKIEEVGSLEKEAADIKNEIVKKEAELESLNVKTSYNRDRLYEIKNEIAKKLHLIEKIRKGKTELQQKLESLQRETLSAKELICSQEENLDNYLREIMGLNSSIAGDTEQLEKSAGMIEESEEETKRLNGELRSVIDRLLKEIDSVKARFTGSEEKKRGLVKKVYEIIARIESSLKRCSARLGDLLYSAGSPGSESFVKELGREVKDSMGELETLREDVGAVLAIQDELARLIFGKEGLHSQKEQIEGRIEKETLRGKALREQVLQVEGRLKRSRADKEEFEKLAGNLRPEIARSREKEIFNDENLKRMRRELEINDESLKDAEFDARALEEKIRQIESEIEAFSRKSGEVQAEKQELFGKTRSHNALIDRLMREMHELEQMVLEKKAQVDELGGSIEKVELALAETQSRIETIMEEFKERYGISLEIYRPEREIDPRAIGERREQLKSEIGSLGQVNLLAIEEFNEIKKRYEYLTRQREDLAGARDDINIAVSKTIKSTKETFLETLDRINHNFNGIFRRLFNGGTTSLYLTKEENIFESGIEINACPPGKNLKRRSLLSGGEKGLTAIALLFAIFMVRPSPFCMLDEVDHDLDEENILRFIKLLKEFTDTTQFIIITHNRRTIEFADVIYGITAEEAGISKVVSLDLMEPAVE